MATPEFLTPQDQPPGALQSTHVEQSASMFQQLQNARVNASYIMARQNPRNLDACRDAMLRECSRPSFCAIDPDPKKNGSSLAIYSLPRKTKDAEGNFVTVYITGLTIRSAEMMMRNWGHMDIAIWPMGEDDKQRIYQVVLTDFQSANTVSEIIHVPKTIEKGRTQFGDVVLSVRKNSYGKDVFTVLATEDEMAMKKNALVSKARRNLILQSIPGWLVEECISKIRETAAKKDAEDPDKARRTLFDAFSAVGVSPDQLAIYLGHSNQLSNAELEELRGIYSGIREGVVTWREVVQSKQDETDHAEYEPQIAKLLEESGRNAAQIRNLRGKYIGKPKDLIEFLQKEAAKKAQVQPDSKPQAEKAPSQTSTQAQQQTTPAADPEPQPEKSQPKAEPQQAKASAPPPDQNYGEW